MSDELTKTPGQILRVEREKTALSVRQIAEKLHLLPYQVEALEADDYLTLNGDIFCRGYLKSYAVLLGMDAKPLIDRYLGIRPQRPEKDYPVTASTTQIQRPHKGRSIQYWCLAASLVVIVALWFYGSQYSDDGAEVVGVSEVIVDGHGENAVAVAGKGRSEKTIPANVSTPANRTVSEQSAEIGLSSVEIVLGDNDIAAASAEGSLSFRFSGDCWVEVTDSQQTVLLAELKRAKDSLQLSGVAPFKVLLGFAPNVELEYNGEPVNIRVNRRNNSANFTVGQL
ncbi:MAG: RodZ domain-containing protein [Oceanicoccus sp.]